VSVLEKLWPKQFVGTVLLQHFEVGWDCHWHRMVVAEDLLPIGDPQFFPDVV
jgi:hypothetical protein